MEISVTFSKLLEKRKRKIQAKPHPPHAVMLGQSIPGVQESPYHSHFLSVEHICDSLSKIKLPVKMPGKWKAKGHGNAVTMGRQS